MSSKKLETIVYYERYVVIQPGIREDEGSENMVICLLKKNTSIFWILFQKTTSILPDEDPNKFIAKMGAEAVHDLLATY